MCQSTLVCDVSIIERHDIVVVTIRYNIDVIVICGC